MNNEMIYTIERAGKNKVFFRCESGKWFDFMAKKIENTESDYKWALYRKTDGEWIYEWANFKNIAAVKREIKENTHYPVKFINK